MTVEHQQRTEDVESGGGDRSREQVVQEAVEVWIEKLTDMSGRNQLLYYRDLKKGTLSLDDAAPSRLKRLLGGKTEKISQMFAASEEQPDRPSVALDKARVIHRRARTVFEEKGIDTLWVTVGMATWETTTSAATPQAPVLLCPATLKQVGAAGGEYELSLAGDWVVNEALLQLLDTQFAVRITEEDLPVGDGLELPELRQQVQSTLQARCREVPAFDINGRTVLGTFAYQKLPMVRDLKGAVEQITDHDIIAAIAGWADAQEAVRAANRTSSGVSAADPDDLAPADEFLVLDADSSQNQVINTALAGTSMVVQGPPGTGKSQTIANLIATAVARGKKVLFVAEKRAAIEAVIGRLDDVGLRQLVMDLHGGVGTKKQVATDIKTALDAVTSVTPNEHLNDLHQQLERSRADLNAHAKALHQTRQPWGRSVVDLQHTVIEHRDAPRDVYAFPGHKIDALDDKTIGIVVDRVEEWAALTRSIRSGDSPWGDTTVTTEQDVENVASALSSLASEVLPTAKQQLDHAVQETGLNRPSNVSGWGSFLATLQAVANVLLVAGPDVFDEDLPALVADLEPGSRSSWSRMVAQLFNSSYRAAKKTVGERWLGDKKPNGAQCHELVDDAAMAQTLWQEHNGEGRPRLPSQFDTLTGGYEAMTNQLAALGAHVVSTDLQTQDVDQLQGDVRARLADQQTLIRLPRIHQLEGALAADGFSGLMDAARTDAICDEHLASAVLHDWAQAVLRKVSMRDPVLTSFDGQRLHETAATFQQADVDHVATTATRVLRAVAERAHAARNLHPGQDQLLTKEAKKKTRHIPVRDLFDRTTDVLTAVKPCWTMSPLSVAQVLPATQMFDLVVFDEASQITPEDAVSALLRADQAIVAGDRLQLPPTSFFSKDDDEGEDDDESLTTGFESILDVLDTLLKGRMLSWHYRSTDERLIGFSNAHIYDGSLTTFPGIGGDGIVQHELVPDDGGPRVGTKSRDAEVQRVVDLLISHAMKRPEESIGVIAFGLDHANRIEAELQQRLSNQSDPQIDEFFAPNAEERVFVKNIERVQGDERDAIILTVGYCKTQQGTLPFRFGPLNHEGGERRLNVAVTRARKRMTLVSSFTHVDMPPGKSNKRGVQLLREYLQYAASGGNDLTTAFGDHPLNPFEHDVKQRLEAAGLIVHPQVGASGYRIDFAVTHPELTDRYILAVEADGASYHSSATARDRDRLRQQVLERLGWRFVRIWSTDWFYDPGPQIDRVLDAIEDAVERIDAGRPVTAPAVAPDMKLVAATATPKGSGRGPLPGLPRRAGSIDDYSKASLQGLAKWVRSDGMLRTDEEIVREMFDQMPFSRLGKNIRAALEDAVKRTR